MLSKSTTLVSARIAFLTQNTRNLPLGKTRVSTSNVGEKEGSFTQRKGADDAVKLIVVMKSDQEMEEARCRNLDVDAINPALHHTAAQHRLL